MNKILDELIYDDDKIINGQYFGTVSSPSKIKLRAKTFDGLNNNLAKIQNANNDFLIPGAYMAQDVYQSSYVQPVNVLSNEFERTNVGNMANITAAPKKLKTGSDQLRALSKEQNVMSNTFQMPINNTASYNTEVVPNYTAPAVDKPVYVEQVTTQFVPPVASVEPVQNMNIPVQETSVPTQNLTDITQVVSVPINNVEPVVTPTEEPIYNEPVYQKAETQSMDQIDAVRQKAYETPIVHEETQTDKATQTDEFAKLDKVTQEYNRITEEYNKSKTILETKKEEESKSLNEVKNMENDISKIDEKISSYRSTIDSAKKDISQIKEEMRQVTEKINRKIELINAAKEKKLREKLSVEEEASKLMDSIKTNNQKLDQMKQELVDKGDQKESLAKEESEVLQEKMRIQEEYERKLEILKAMTLPAGVEE